jgi:hypothetical protein
MQTSDRYTSPLRRSGILLAAIVALLLALLPSAVFAGGQGSSELGSPAHATGRYRQQRQQPQRNYGYQHQQRPQHQQYQHHGGNQGYVYWSGDDDDKCENDRWEGHHSNWDGSRTPGHHSSCECPDQSHHHDNQRPAHHGYRR